MHANPPLSDIDPPYIKLKSKTILRYFVEIVVLAVVYHLAARVGLQMAYVQQNTSPVWPPSGIALAALLIFGIRDWPGITLGVVIGSLLTGAPPGLAVGFGIANTLEALIGATILTRWIRFDRGINHVRDVGGLVFAAACGTLVSATLGVATLTLFQHIPLAAFPTLWITWFVGNLLGCLVVTPLILTWVYDFPRRWSTARKVEVAHFPGAPGARLFICVRKSFRRWSITSGADLPHLSLCDLGCPAIGSGRRFQHGVHCFRHRHLGHDPRSGTFRGYARSTTA